MKDPAIKGCTQLLVVDVKQTGKLYDKKKLTIRNKHCKESRQISWPLYHYTMDLDSDSD